MNDREPLSPKERLMRALWQIYRRPDRPQPWERGGNLPWDEPAFSRRMLQEHLDESHGAASRVSAEREQQLRWFWQRLQLQPCMRLLDVTCGPGLYAVAFARQGLEVVGVDFSPAAIAYAHELAERAGVADRCRLIEADVRRYDFGHSEYDAALLLYGQLAVFPRDQAQALLTAIGRALRPGARLCIELLDQNRVDREDSSWWFTDDSGLWGEGPFLSLGERFWDEAHQLSCERYYTLHLESGELDEFLLCDQTYAPAEVAAMLHQAGFETVETFLAWDGLPLYDADEWIVYVAETASD